MLDPLLETQIQEYLAGKDAIVAAYLFGSAAMEQAHPLSDLDFALLLDASLDEELAFNLRLETMANLARLARRPVDVVLLNQAPPLLLFQVFRHGRLIFERDKIVRCLFQMQALNRYYDFKPYLDYHQTRFRERVLQEGLGHGYRGHRDALAEARQLSAKLATTGKNPAG
jgi:predicted nucleotidyltransferase